MKLGSLLSLPALALRTAASALRVLADINEQLADTVRANGAGASGRTRSNGVRSQPSPTLTAVPDLVQGPVGDDRPTAAKTAQPVSVPPPAPAPIDSADDAERGTVAAAPGFDAAELASQTAPNVLAALDTLGTVELAQLYEYESRHRRRRTVLQAIDAAAAPPADARDDEIVSDDDVREPDELVYSTETPRR